jgi:hypothetical protein
MDHDRIMAYQGGKYLRYNIVALLIGEKHHGRDNSLHSAVTLTTMFSSTVLTPFKENDINYSIIH